MNRKIKFFLLTVIAVILCACFLSCGTKENNEGLDAQSSVAQGSQGGISTNDESVGSGDNNIDSIDSSVNQSSGADNEGDDKPTEGDNENDSDNKPTSSSGKDNGDNKPSEGEGDKDTRKYFLATVIQNENIIASPYVKGDSTPEELKGLYYSACTPGGAPVGDGTGSIWLILKPTPTCAVRTVDIVGDYSEVEELGRDLYCISGVKSDLTVTTTSRELYTTTQNFFSDYGYGISNDGMLTITWVEDESMPLRYVELSYNDSQGEQKRYADPENGKIDLFEMKENEIYTISIRAISGKKRSAAIKIECCYMPAPKAVSFPRVEITTENLVWPSCDFVASPDGCWGAGITNAFYEQCKVTIYDENNHTVYTSLNEDFSGAKLKIRGNTSARYASSGRYPYKLKLDKKADLLNGLVDRPVKEGNSDKSWVLLNYGNYDYRIIGDAIADAVGTSWSPDYCYVSLYLNGEYRGLYVLSESVKEGNGVGDEQGRVKVEENGFVFECDAYWWNEELSFSTPLTQNTPMHFTFKHPDSDNMTKDSEQVKYLKDYLTRFEEALTKDDDSYLEYIDLDSFVKWLLVSDYLSIEDGGGCNLFLYKKDATDESKLCMGPNWDFDSFMGGVDSLSVIRMSWDGAPFYYQYLIRKPSFNARYCELFKETYGKILTHIEGAFDLIDVESHYELIKYDNIRFGTSLKTLTSRKEVFLKWFNEHLDWMKTQF